MVEGKQLNFGYIDSYWTDASNLNELNVTLEDFYQRTNQAWQELGFDLPPTPERNRGYGKVTQQSGPIKANFYPHFDHPWSRLNFSGWDVEVKKRGAKEQIETKIDTDGNLQRVIIIRPQEVEPTYRKLADLITEARFSEDRLQFFWQEEQNGTFFPDPRGGTDQIWPFWLNPNTATTRRWGRGKASAWEGIYYQLSRKRPQLSEKHWEEYLEAIRAGIPVISGRTLRKVRQTANQATHNLEAWRNYIFYKSRQAFEFRLNDRVTPISGVGYVYTNYRDETKHVSKNPVHYHPLDNSETVIRLDSWKPPF